MVALQKVIEFLHPNAEPQVHYSVLSHNGVERIAMWDTDILGPVPTVDQLIAVANSSEFLAWKASRRKQLKKAIIRKMVLESKDPVVIILRNLTKLLYQSLVEVRREYSQLRADVRTANIATTAKATPSMTLNEATETLITLTAGEVDTEPGDT